MVASSPEHGLNRLSRRFLTRKIGLTINDGESSGQNPERSDPEFLRLFDAYHSQS